MLKEENWMAGGVGAKPLVVREIFFSWRMRRDISLAYPSLWVTPRPIWHLWGYIQEAACVYSYSCVKCLSSSVCAVPLQASRLAPNSLVRSWCRQKGGVSNQCLRSHTLVATSLKFKKIHFFLVGLGTLLCDQSTTFRALTTLNKSRGEDPAELRKLCDETNYSREYFS